MTIRRTLSTASVALLLIAALTACFSIPGVPTNPGGGGGETETADLTGTTWSGTDSDGDDWGFEFQSDGTLGLEFNSEPFDDPADTWTQTGSAVTLHVTGFEDGDIDFTGTYDGGSSIALTGDYAGRPFTLTLTEG